MKHKLVVSILLLAGILLAACGAPAAVESAPAEETVAVLKLTGPATELSLTADDIAAKDQIEVEYTGKDGVATMYTGALVTELLPEISDASTLSFIAADGYSAEISGAELLPCTNCIVAFQEEGGLRLVMPDFSSKLQVKDLVEIYIQ